MSEKLNKFGFFAGKLFAKTVNEIKPLLADDEPPQPNPTPTLSAEEKIKKALELLEINYVGANIQYLLNRYTKQSNEVVSNLKVGINEEFVNKSTVNTVIGWYFPQALQEFDIASQRSQMKELPQPSEFGVCLSGAKDIASALVGTPELLISSEFYTPIICLSSYVHADPRLVLLLKAYGPHMEFWCMSQMLTKNVTQVSEQWSGGLTIYDYL